MIASIVSALGYATARRFYHELLILIALSLAAGAWGVFQFAQFDFLRLCRGFDFWFDSDPARTVANITSRWVEFHGRSMLHPLYSLFIAGPFGAIQDVLGLRTSTLTALYVAVQSACFCATLYIALRATGLLRVDALLGVLLANSTAAAIFWMGFPEWIVFGAASVVLSVCWIAAPEALRNRVTGAAQNLISASMVVTNWAIGAAASLASDWPKLRWGQAFAHTRDALAFMAGLSVLQYLIFPQAGPFLNIWGEASLFVGSSGPDRPLIDLVVEFFAQTLVAPNFALVEGPRTVPGWGVLLMSGQSQGVALNLVTISIFVLWIALWAMGVMAALRGELRKPVVVLTSVALAYFFVLHMILGGEIFLFSLQVAPFMAMVALWGAMSSGRRNIIRGLCLVLVALSFYHNYPAFSATVAEHNAIDLSWLNRTDHAAPALVAQTQCD